MPEWIWLRREALTALHAEQLAEHGGAGGVRDEGLLSSALARPENLAAYGEPDAFDLAAAYAFGIIRNHPFVDGNKRAAFIAAATFLHVNSWGVTASDKDAVETVLALAAGEESEEHFARWLRANCEAV